MFYTKIKKQAKEFLGNYQENNPATYAAAQQAIGGVLVLDGFIGIENPFGGKKRSGIFGSLFAVIIGLVFVFGSGFIADFMGINKMSETTQATVVQVTRQDTNTSSDEQASLSCTPKVKYTVDGKNYEKSSNIGSSSYCDLREGQSVEINYDPDNPESWAYDLGMIKQVLGYLPLMGAVITISSLFVFSIRLFSIIFGWMLLKKGRVLAKTLPEGTNLSSIKAEIKQNFMKDIFGMGAGASTLSGLGNSAAATVPASQPAQTEVSSTVPTVISPEPTATAEKPEPTSIAPQQQPENSQIDASAPPEAKETDPGDSATTETQPEPANSPTPTASESEVPQTEIPTIEEPKTPAEDDPKNPEEETQ